MKAKILMVFALFLMLTGFYGGDRIVEQSGVNLQEEVDGFAPTPISKPSVYGSDNGNTVILEIRFKAKPKANVIWYHGTKVVEEDHRHEIIENAKSSDEYTAMLIIRDIEMGDTGEDKGNVKNEFGEFNGIIKLNFDPVQNI